MSDSRSSRRLGALLFLLACPLLGFAIGKSGLAFLGVDKDAELGTAALLALAVTFVTGALLAILVHELGHVAAGKSVGMRFRQLVVGPLWIERKEGRTNWRWNRSLTVAGGLALCSFEREEELNAKLLRKMYRYAAGGPVASLLLGLTVLGAWMLVRGTELESDLLRGLRSGLLMTGLVSFMIGVVTLVPSGKSSGSFMSDGERIRRYRRGGDAVLDEVAMAQISGLSMAGVRPRDWPPALVARLGHLRGTDASEAAARMLEANWHLDEGRGDEGFDSMSRAARLIDELPGPGRSALRRTEALWRAERALTGGTPDPATAGPIRELLRDASDGTFAEPWMDEATEAALLALEGDIDLALSRLTTARARLAEARFGASEADVERLELLEAAIRQTSGARVTDARVRGAAEARPASPRFRGDLG